MTIAVLQEWLCMITQYVFGSKGDIFRQCSNDPATVHPLTFNGCQDTRAYSLHLMSLAGRLAGDPNPLRSPAHPNPPPALLVLNLLTNTSGA